jgi:hypothetical protein
VSELFGIFTAGMHEEYARCWLRFGEREYGMSRAQFEGIILGRPRWNVIAPEFEICLAACFLAAVGELGGPSSRLGATRDEALRQLRRRLGRKDMAYIAEIIEDFEASRPHPTHVFGPGMPDLLCSPANASVWTRMRCTLPSRERVGYSLSIPRLWRSLRFSMRATAS